ncbi:MAG: methyl-accepting chemotaxis protein [Burkholderiaceae bacterium]|nr:methyl-accepting chemotaxis protein [Burkholderiaceae bacterium]
MNLRNWRIGQRLGFGFGIILLIMMATIFLVASVQIQTKDASGLPDEGQLIWLAAACLAALLSGGLLAWRITLSVTRPLQEAVSIARKVAAGDLSSQPKISGKDEVSELLQALVAMNVFLLTIVGDVRRGSDSISVASREIAMGNSDLSARTEAQAASLEETASSMDQLTSIVKRNANSAREANQLVLSSAEVATRGGQAVREVVRTMNDIKKSSSEIVDIIGVIDGIAFQTNILALNAAVEAARAGEQGRGFAVVAAEVRNLAQRSATAAKEIKTLITTSVSKVDSGSRVVADAGKTMDEIVQSVRGVAVLIGEIAQASHDQSSGIVEVNQAVAQMDNMTQQNTALVEQAAAAAESLMDQAAAMAKSVSTFRLENNADDAVAMVRSAVSYLHAHGQQNAFAAFSKPEPRFKKRDLYINVIDLEGMTLAHGENATLVGKNLIAMKDADGKAFIKAFVSVARKVGRGWIDYRWPNPVTGVIERKSTYIEQADGVIVGCGIYK